MKVVKHSQGSGTAEELKRLSDFINVIASELDLPSGHITDVPGAKWEFNRISPRDRFECAPLRSTSQGDKHLCRWGMWPVSCHATTRFG